MIVTVSCTVVESLQPTPETRRIAKAKKIMHRVGLELIREKRARIMGMSHREKAEKQTDMQSRDLLTLLIKANMGLDIPEHQRMSEEDILARECLSSSLTSIH